ncbi:MAG TPA: hypothetical protein VNA16_03930 [Abditibacteriaceae bacterium]|nr:hypothetical protein [Abditibacteriaceae bacterium]
MRTSKNAATIWVCLWCLAGAFLQVVNWHEPPLTGWRGVGSCLFLVALLARPPYALPPRNQRPSREWHWRLLIGLISIVLLWLGVWVLYARYYGPLMKMVNHAE